MISVHLKQHAVGSENPTDSQQEGVRRSCQIMSRPLAMLIHVLRVTAQTGGDGWGSRVYATLFFVAVSVFCLMGGWGYFTIGKQMLTDGGGFFQSLLQTYFFGLTFVLMWFTLAVTFFLGRRRTAASLKDAMDMLKDISNLSSFPLQYAKNNRRLIGMLVIILLIAAFGLASYIIVNGAEFKCPLSARYCNLLAVFTTSMLTLVFASFLMITFKFALFCSLFVCGIDTVTAELRALADSGRPVRCTALRPLRLCQGRLSRRFSELTDRLRPELISSVLYGTLSQVIVIFLLIGGQQRDSGLNSVWGANLFLVPAVVSTLVPCCACQAVLDATERTRAALLQLEPPEEAAADRQLAAHLASVQRDLDTFGDLGLFRLQVSTILGNVATVLTYIIIMVQFQMSESGCGDTVQQPANNNGTDFH